MTKINPLGIIRKHLETFGDRDGERRGGDYALFYGVPLVSGVAVWTCFPGLRIGAACRATAINVNAIFIPLAFALMTSLLSLKGRLAEPKADLLVRHLYHNTAYCVLLSVISVTVLFLIEIFGTDGGRWFAAAFVLMACHILLNILMVAKRFNAIMCEALKK